MKGIYKVIMDEYLQRVNAISCQLETGFVLLKLDDEVSLERIVYDYDEFELTFEEDWWEGEKDVKFLNCITDSQIEQLLRSK